MKLRILTTAAAGVFAISLAACQTVSLQEYAEAANTLDPGCGKKVHAQVQPVLIFGWPVPIVSGTYDKECKGAEDVQLDETTKQVIRQIVAEALEEFR